MVKLIIYYWRFILSFLQLQHIFFFVIVVAKLQHNTVLYCTYCILSFMTHTLSWITNQIPNKNCCIMVQYLVHYIMEFCPYLQNLNLKCTNSSFHNRKYIKRNQNTNNVVVNCTMLFISYCNDDSVIILYIKLK